MPTKKEQPQIFTMPNSVEAEQSILCCILRDETFQADIIASLKAEDFYQNNHATIFSAMKEINSVTRRVGDETKNNTVNLTSLIDHLRRNGKLADVGDIDYITRLNDFLPSTANFEEYKQIVIRASKMRQLIRICGEVTQKARSYASAEDVITYAEEEIFKLAQGESGGGLVSLSEETGRTLMQINERFKNPGMFRGIETGFKWLDRMTNGLHGGELIILAARPGVGKSALAMNMVEHVAKSGKTVAVFSLEMSNQQLIERLLSSMSTVPLDYIKSGQLPGGVSDLSILRVAQDTICSKMRLFGNEKTDITTAEIASQCRRLKAQHGLDLIVIDYLQLMNGDDREKNRNDGRTQEVAAISRSLKKLAKQLNVPIIALSQLKRDAEIRNIKGKEGGGEPVLSDLRESGAIEQDADIVMFIHKETSDNGSARFSLIIAKHRNGETGNMPLHWLGKIVRFVDDDYLNRHNIRISPAAEPVAQQPEIPDAEPEYSEPQDEAAFIKDDKTEN